MSNNYRELKQAIPDIVLRVAPKAGIYGCERVLLNDYYYLKRIRRFKRRIQN